MPPRPLTVDDLWAMPRVGAPVPDPAGRRLVVPVTSYAMEKNEGWTRLWLLPAGARNAGDGRPSDPARPLTPAGISCTQPAWSPDGGSLFFVRKPGGEAAAPDDPAGRPRFPDKPQLFRLRLDGGEAERLTDLPLGVADPRSFPDGRRVAFLAPILGEAPGPEATVRRLREREKDPVKAHVTEDRIYRHWDRWLTDGAFHHIFVLDLESGELLDLTPASRRWFRFMDPTDNFDIAPDGREIAFSAAASRPPHDPIWWGVFTVPVPRRLAGARPRAPRALTRGHQANAARPRYSPDGRWILFGMQRELDFYADRTRLVLHDRRSGRQAVLTEDWPFSADERLFTPDGKRILVVAECEGRSALFELDWRAARRRPGAAAPRELMRGGTFGGVRAAGGGLVFTRSSLAEPPEVWRCDLHGRQAHRVTAFARPALEGRALATVREMRFAGAGGRRVQMFLLWPPGTKPPRRGEKPRRRLPLLQLVHGGPHGVFGDQWHWRWNAQLFAAPGYLTAMVNFHGSTGWGQDFAASILGRWGDQPYEDVMKATDLLVERGWADPARLAAAGGSYGGYMMAWIASQTDRFACLVNHAGVNDLQAAYASDWTQGRRRSMGGEPWEDIAGMDRYNPMRHARGFASPMLVLHGERDYRVPYTQGLEIYNVYKAMGRPARLVLYPDENHWVLKPCNSRHWYGEVLDWLDRWLARGGRRR